MAKFIRDKQGNIWEDEGDGIGRRLTPEEVQVRQSGQNPLETLGQSAAVSAAQAYLGGKTLLGQGTPQDAGSLATAQRLQAGMGEVNPIAQFAGQVAPALGVAAATGGAGALPTIAAEAAMGAAYSPEAPLQGAAMGAAAGGLPFAAPLVAQGARAAGRMAPNLGTSLGNAVQSIPVIGPRMADRQLERLARIDAETTVASPKTPERMLPGYFSPDELTAQGIPLTRGDAMALYARNADEYSAAQKVRNTEELQRSGPAGSNVESIRNQQKVATTDYIARQIDPENTGLLTDTKMGDVFRTLGKQFDEISVKAGDIEAWQVTPKGGKNALEETLGSLKTVADNAADSSAAQLNKIVTQYEKAVAEGSFRLKTFNDIDRQLSNMIDAGMRQGDYAKLSDAGVMRTALRELQERVLSDADKITLKEARRKYALASALVRPGSRNAAGEVNIGALRNAWNLNPSYTKKNIAQDDLGRALETSAFLQQRIAPTSGTAERLIANAPNAAANLAGKAGTGLAIGAGVAGFNSLFGN